MPSLKVQALPGIYYAGFTRPWYVSQGMVTGKLEDAGFKNVQWHSRKKDAPPVDPRSYQTYSDDWDEWISAVSPDARTITLPAAPAWLVGVGFGAQAPQAVPQGFSAPSYAPTSFGPSQPSQLPAQPSSPAAPSLATTLEQTAQEAILNASQQAQASLSDPATQDMLRTAAPAALFTEVSLIVILGLYAKHRAEEKAATARARALAKQERGRRGR